MKTSAILFGAIVAFGLLAIMFAVKETGQASAGAAVCAVASWLFATVFWQIKGD